MTTATQARTAIAGATAIARYDASRSVRPDRSSARSTSLEGFHSSRRRRVTSTRTTVRIDRVEAEVRLVGQEREGDDGLHDVALRAFLAGGEMLAQRHLQRLVRRVRQRWQAARARAVSRTTIAVQNHAAASTVQPSSSNAVSVAGTRLRRRLSKSFHCDSSDSGLRSRRPSAPGTRRRSQPASCQSPRIQRRRRATSAL